MQEHVQNAVAHTNPSAKKKLLRRPISRVSSDAYPNKRSKFQGTGEGIKFVSRPGKNPHTLRISPNSVHHENKVYAKLSAQSDVVDDVYKNTPTTKVDVSKISGNRLLVPQLSPTDRGKNLLIYINSVNSVFSFQFKSQ